MDPIEVEQLTKMLHRVRGSTVGKTNVGPAGVHIQIRLNDVNRDDQWLDILCCGKMLLIYDEHRAKVLVDSSNYIDRVACQQIPKGTVILRCEVDASIDALALRFDDKTQLVMQAIAKDGESYCVYVSSWMGAPYVSEQECSIVMKPSDDRLCDQKTDSEI